MISACSRRGTHAQEHHCCLHCLSGGFCDALDSSGPLKDIRVEDEVHIGIQSLRVPTLGHEDSAFISELIYERIQGMVLWRGGGNIQKEVTEGVLLRAVRCLGPLPQSVSCQLR